MPMKLEQGPDGKMKYEDALVLAMNMLFCNTNDVAAALNLIDGRAYPEIEEMLEGIATSTRNVSRMVIEVMPEEVRQKLDEVWSKAAKDIADAVAMEEKAHAKMN